MTVSSTSRVAGPYIGNGSIATFPFSFKVFQTTDLLVATLNTSTGAITDLALASDYSAILNPDQDSNPGGSITLLAGGLAVGLNLSITTDMPEAQGVNFVSGGGFFPEVISLALDVLTILVQQLHGLVNRAIRVPFADGGDMELPSAQVRAGKVIMFDANGDLQLVPVASGSIVPGAQTSPSTVDGVNKDFTFSAAASPTPAILVFAGGVFQTAVTDFSAPVFVSGTTWKITFVNAPANGPITILMLG